MFTRLFAERGLSLDRLRALVEVGATGSIVRAAGSDPARQSQYSRQLKELEDFFQTELTERYGKGIRLTANGRELARISRFFLLGLSNFQRGCLAERQTFRLGASPTFMEALLLPVLASPAIARSGVGYAVEAVPEDEIERRLHDLTLDFGVVTQASLSRPLQVRELGGWRIRLWVPRGRFPDPTKALRAWCAGQTPWVWPARDLASLPQALPPEPALFLTCHHFLEAKTALDQGELATLLPDFLSRDLDVRRFLPVDLPALAHTTFRYHLAWNPRLLRLNPHASRRRDALWTSLRERCQQLPGLHTRGAKPPTPTQ